MGKNTGTAARGGLLGDVILSGAVAAALALAAIAGLTAALGAHPWWAVQTGAIGALGGAVAFVALSAAGLRPRAIATLGLPVAGLAFLAAHFGKAAFAASYAENALAGRLWYFGWFILSGAVCVALCGMLAHLRRR